MRVCFLDLDGTLLGPGGSLLTGSDGAFSDGGAQALGVLRAHAVHAVLVSGRTRPQLTAAARILGADGAIAELGASSADYPTPDGMSVAAAIEATGVIDALVGAPMSALERFVQPGITREGTVLLRGIAPPGAVELVARFSSGALRLVDNGVIAPDGVRAWHVAPQGAGKGPAVAAYLAELAASPEDALAVGNSREDAEMGAVGVRVALVGNVRDSDPALAASADWVTQAGHGEGVLEAVRVWLGV